MEYLLARSFSVSVSEKKSPFARKLKAAKTFPLQIRRKRILGRNMSGRSFQKEIVYVGSKNNLYFQSSRAALNIFLLVNEQNLELAFFYF